MENINGEDAKNKNDLAYSTYFLKIKNKSASIYNIKYILYL